MNDQNNHDNQQNRSYKDDPFAASDTYYQNQTNDPYAQFYEQNTKIRRPIGNIFSVNTDGRYVFLTVIKALLFALLFVAIQTVVVLAVEIPMIIDLTLKGVSDPSELERQVIEIISPYSNYLSALSGLVTIITVFLIIALKRKNPLKELSFNKVKLSTVALCFIAGITLNFSCSVLFMLMPQQWLENYAQASEGLDTGSLFSYILGGVIFAPLTEEIIFRGSIMKRCSKCMSAALASLIAAVVFGICHGDLVWAIYAGSLGFILGLLLARFNSIIPCIIVHFSFNSVSAVQRVVFEIPAVKNMSETQEMIFNGVYNIFSFAMVAVSVALVTYLLTSEKLLIKKTFKESFSTNE